ncbi:MAG: hypothetical protein AABW88_03945 [Nanoarchaeota archaeon]
MAVIKERLEYLLTREHDKVTTSPECKSQLVEFLTKEGRSSRFELEFLIRLSSAGDRVITKEAESCDKLESADEDLLMKLCQLNNEGHQKAVMLWKLSKEGDYKGGILGAQAQFLVNNANISRVMFKHYNDVVFAEGWYEDRKQAAALISEVNPRHASRCYEFAAEAAYRIFEKTGDENWFNAWKESCDLAIKLREKINIRSACFLARDMATIFFNRYQKYANVEHLNSAVKYYMQALKMSKECYDLPNATIDSMKSTLYIAGEILGTKFLKKI